LLRPRPIALVGASPSSSSSSRPALKKARRRLVAVAAGGPLPPPPPPQDGGAADADDGAWPPRGSVTSSVEHAGNNEAPRPPGARVDPITGMTRHPAQPEGWWEGRVTRRGARGPPGDEAPWGGMAEPRSREEAGRVGMGATPWSELQVLRRNERQETWDALRAEATRRWEAGGGSRGGDRGGRGVGAGVLGGSLPPGFHPSLLDSAPEHPGNTFLRQLGLSDYQLPPERAEWLGFGSADFGDGDAAAAAAADAAADAALEAAAAAPPTPDDGGGSSGDGRNSGNSGDGGNSGGGGPWWWRRWWREDDPYWPLRDWGDHPMRWWTVAFGLFFLVGGLTAPLGGGDTVPAYVAATALLTCGAMMSDMRHPWMGHLGVKWAWLVCAAVAAWDFACGWRLGPLWRLPPHAPERPSPFPALLRFCFGFERDELPRWLGGAPPGSAPRPPSMRGVPASAAGRALGGGCDPAHFPDTSELPLGHRPPQFDLLAPAGASACLCALYMLTGMGGLSGEGTAIPESPGATFKMTDVSRKTRSWDAWGYGHLPMGTYAG